MVTIQDDYWHFQRTQLFKISALHFRTDDQQTKTAIFAALFNKLIVVCVRDRVECEHIVFCTGYCINRIYDCIDKFISLNLRILSYSQQQSVDTMADFFVSEPSASWTPLSSIGTKDTGYSRNHNAGLLSDPYGWMVEPNTLHVLYSVSLTNEPSNSLWTYRIHKYDIPLEN